MGIYNAVYSSARSTPFFLLLFETRATATLGYCYCLYSRIYCYCLYSTLYLFSKTAVSYRFIVPSILATPRIALKIQLQRYDEVEPMLGQVQDVSSIQNDFVRPSVSEIGKLVQIGIVPVQLRVPRRWVTLGVQIEILAVFWMTQDVPSPPA